MQPDPTATVDPTLERFEWHPRYRGKTVAEVRDEVRQELEYDQRVFALVLEGAEREENATLAKVIELERKWGGFDLDWATADAADLATRIAAFEQDRDRQRELFPVGRYRDRSGQAAAIVGRDAPARPSLGGIAGNPRSRPIWLLAVVVVVVVVVLLLLAR